MIYICIVYFFCTRAIAVDNVLNGSCDDTANFDVTERTFPTLITDTTPRFVTVSILVTCFTGAMLTARVLHTFSAVLPHPAHLTFADPWLPAHSSGSAAGCITDRSVAPRA